MVRYRETWDIELHEIGKELYWKVEVSHKTPVLFLELYRRGSVYQFAKLMRIE